MLEAGLVVEVGALGDAGLERDVGQALGAVGREFRRLELSVGLDARELAGLLVLEAQAREVVGALARVAPLLQRDA